MADGKVTIDTELDNSGFQKGVTNLKKQTGGLKSALSGIGKAVAGAFAVKTIVNFGRQAVELGSSVAEVQNVVDTAFGEMAYRIEDFAASSIQNFGMSGLAAKRTASTYMSMARGMGLAMDEAADMSLSLTALTADVASFYNISQELADVKLRSVFTGETETLKDLGVVMTQANLEAFALEQGITKSVQAMSQAEQVSLRYAFVMDKLSLAQGDFARTSDSWANQTRILSMQWQEFMSVIGQALITVFTPLVRVLNQIVAYLIQAANAFNLFISSIFGGTAQQIQGTQAAASGVGEAIAGSVDSENELADATKKTGKAAKGALASFDKLNVLAQESASGTSGAGGAAGSVTVPPLETAETETQAGKLADAFQKVGQIFQEYVIDPINRGLAFLEGPVKRFGALFQSVFDQILLWAQPVADWLRTGFKDALASSISAVMKILGGLLDSLAMIYETMWDFWKPVIDWFVNEGLPLFSDVWIELTNTLTTAFDAVKTVFDTVWMGVVAPALTLISDILVDLMEIVKELWYQYGKPIMELVRQAIEGTKNLFLRAWEVIRPVFDKLFETIDWLWTEHLSPLLSKIGEFVAKLIEFALMIYNQFILPVVTWFTETFGPPIAAVFGSVIEVVGNLIATISDLVSDTISVLSSLLDFLMAVFQGDWEAAWEAVGDIFGGVWNGMVDLVKGVVNTIAGIINHLLTVIESAVNGVIDMINSISFTIPDWVPLFGGNHFGLNIPRLNIPRIPKLAQGAVIPPNREFLAVLGDQKSGVNVEAPLDTIVRAFEQALAQSGGRGGDIYLQVDGETFARILAPYLDRNSRRRGVKLVEGVIR